MMRDVFTRALLVAAAIAAIGSAASYQPAGAAPTGHSPSYQNGYDTATVCRLELDGGAPPPNPTDWMRGCMDALHDLGFAP